MNFAKESYIRIFFKSMLLFLLFLSSCSRETDYTVQIFGNLNSQNDTRLYLDALPIDENTVGLGRLVNGLGMVLILNSEVFSGTTYEDLPLVNKSKQIYVDFLITSNVNSWKSIQLNKTIHSKEELSIILRQQLSFSDNPEEISPIPFVIKGNIDKMQWHLTEDNKRVTTIAYTNLISQSGSAYSNNIEVDIVGFFLIRNTGQSQNTVVDLHLHFLTVDKLLIGHIDQFEGLKNVMLSIPR